MSFDTLLQPLTPAPKHSEIFINFSAKYLLPQVKLMGDEFMKQLNNVSWSAFGIADRNYPNYDEFDNKLFCLAHTNSNLDYWMDNYEYYLYQDDMVDKVMFIIELPINNRNDFLEGNYSKLYEKEVINDIIMKYRFDGGIQYETSVWQIVNKTEMARQIFEEKVNRDFKLEPKIIINLDQEYEYPPQLNNEIFNYEAPRRHSMV